MPKDSPGYDRDVKERGLHANDGNDTTLAGYLSSLLYLLSVPVCLGLAYAGYAAGYYGQMFTLAVFGGCLTAVIVLTFLVMHIRTR